MSRVYYGESLLMSGGNKKSYITYLNKPTILLYKSLYKLL